MCWNARTRWGCIFDIDAKRVQIEEEEMRTHDPNFWEDQKAAEAQMKKVKDLKRWVEKYEAVHNAAQEVQLSFDFYKEELVTEADVDQAYEKAITLIEDLEMQNMLRAEEDKMSAVLKIVAGADRKSVV